MRAGRPPRAAAPRRPRSPAATSSAGSAWRLSVTTSAPCVGLSDRSSPPWPRNSTAHVSSGCRVRSRSRSAGERAERRRGGHRVLHLDEPHDPLRRVDAVAPVDPLGLQVALDRPRRLRRRGRVAPRLVGALGERLEDAPVEHRQPEELEVARTGGRRDRPLLLGLGVRAVPRALVQPVGRDDRELERHEHAEHAEREPGVGGRPAGRGRRSAAPPRPSAPSSRGCRTPPEPWVPVAVAPAIACVSTSPWFASPTPAARSGSPRSAMRVPAPHDRGAAVGVDGSDAGQQRQVEQQAVGRAQRRERVAGARDAHPVVGCPRRGAARSATEAGRAIWRGRHVTLPAQLLHESHRRMVAGRGIMRG